MILDHLTTIISIVGEYLWDSIQKENGTSEEISQNTLDIIGFYCDKVDDDGAGYDMYLFPDDDEKLSSLLTELKAYDEEFKKLSTDEQENAEGSNYDLMCISRDYETILYYIEQANHPSELVIFHKRQPLSVSSSSSVNQHYVGPQEKSCGYFFLLAIASIFCYNTPH